MDTSHARPRLLPIRLGVNVDHVATLRQARRARLPDPVNAGLEAERAGANIITMHLREDRRHIQDRDVEAFAAACHSGLNLEIAATAEMKSIALKVRPEAICIVPEGREELTTEGGLNASGDDGQLQDFCAELAEANMTVSLFVEPDNHQIEAASRIGATAIELHTGSYAAASGREQQAQLQRLIEAADFGEKLGLRVHAGHGLNFHNVGSVAAIAPISELNIGHAIISEAVFMGLAQAVDHMKRLMLYARQTPVFPLGLHSRSL